MLNPNIEIKKWFYTNLTSASGLVVYDGFAPEGAGNEYIVLTGRTSSQDQGKEGYTNSISITVFYTNLASASGLVVYDGFAPEGAGNEYIVMTGRTSSQEQGKAGYTNSISIVVDIITKNANFGYKRAEQISDLVLDDINSDTVITLSNGFTASSLSVESIRNLDGLNPLDNVFRVLITYNITITQN